MLYIAQTAKHPQILQYVKKMRSISGINEQNQSGRRESGRVIAVPVVGSANITTSRWLMMSADLSEHGTSARTAVQI